jgi:hypothetical protein
MKNSIQQRKSDGFIEIIVVIVIALIALHLLGIDLKELLSKQVVQDFAIYMRDMLKLVWADILDIIQWVKDLPAAE